MSPRAIILTLAALFAAAGLSLGFTTIRVDHPDDTKTTSCGSVLKPISSASLSFSDGFSGENTKGDCHGALADRKPYVFGGLGLAAVALIVSFTASGTKPTNADGSKKPSIWR